MSILLVVAAPSGVGKTTVVEQVVKRTPDLIQSVSYTTRAMRSGEQPNKSYTFMSVSDFTEKAKQGGFIEYASVYSALYGTGKADIAEYIKKQQDVVLVLDWQGARQLKSLYPQEVVSVFLFPPSIGVLLKRLQNRTRSEAEQKALPERLAAVAKDLSHADVFDYWIVNDELEQSVQSLCNIYHAECLRKQRISQQKKQWLEELLEDAEQNSQWSQ